MKKHINGKLYNSEAGKVIGTWNNGCSSDLDAVEESLILKSSGEFFIYGYGGPRTPYARAVPYNSNCWSSGGDIFPLTYDEAKKWALEYLSVDEYDACFGELVENEDNSSKSAKTFSISDFCSQKISRLSQKRGKSQSEIIEELIRKAEEIQ